MHALLTKLREDHVNFARLLKLLHAQASLLAAGRNADYWLMEDVVDYLERYSDVVHHAREDAIYGVARERLSDQEPLFERLLEEHRQLHDATVRAQETVAGVLNDMVQDRSAVAGALVEFVELQYQHMTREETQVFPLLAARLSEADWDLIAARLPEAADPLFGADVAQEYRALLRRLVN